MTLTKVVTKEYSNKELDELGNGLLSFSCEPLIFNHEDYSLGDEIILLDPYLDVRDKLRIVGMTVNPYDLTESTIEFANFVPGIDSRTYNTETSMLTKDTTYNGVSVGPENGFSAVREDEKAKVEYRSTGLAMYTCIINEEGVVESTPRLYYKDDEKTNETKLIFDGELAPTVINKLIRVIRDAKLIAENWTGSTAPYTQTLAIKDLVKDETYLYDVTENATVSELEAFMKAGFVAEETADEEESIVGLTFSALLEKPTVDIPINILILGGIIDASDDDEAEGEEEV